MRVYMASITNDTEGWGVYVVIRAHTRREALRLASCYAHYLSKNSSNVRSPDVWCEELRLVPRHLETSVPKWPRRSQPPPKGIPVFSRSKLVYSIFPNPWCWADTGEEIPERHPAVRGEA